MEILLINLEPVHNLAVIGYPQLDYYHRALEFIPFPTADLLPNGNATT